MDDEKLFDGVGVVIDDHVFNGENMVIKSYK